MTEIEKQKVTMPSWGATWLLPDKWSAAWGARAIADPYPTTADGGATHVASLLADRQNGLGKAKYLKQLIRWINENVLPIRLAYRGESEEVTILDDGEFHARWTPDRSYGYLYIIAWMD